MIWFHVRPIFDLQTFSRNVFVERWFIGTCVAELIYTIL